MPGLLGKIIHLAHQRSELRPALLPVILGAMRKKIDFQAAPTKADPQQFPEEARELASDLAHQQWSGWMRYLFSKCKRNADGTVTIPAWAVERWIRQMSTPYKDLPEEEKDSDRKEADKVLALLT